MCAAVAAIETLMQHDPFPAGLWVQAYAAVAVVGTVKLAALAPLPPLVVMEMAPVRGARRHGDADLRV